MPGGRNNDGEDATMNEPVLENNGQEGSPMALGSRTRRTFLTITLLVLLAVPLAWAIRPLYSPFAVVAGSQYTSGYQDGNFSTARFNQPLGLAVSDDGTRLFVADSLNQRIRVIHLDKNNEVGTVAGQGAPGTADGPLAQAQFHDPRGVLYLPGDRLVVNDYANQSLRFLDLTAGTVTTYRGGPWGATADPKPPVLLNGIKAMAYLPSAHSLLFTQPEAGLLNALDLTTGQMTATLKGSTQLPHPSALWIQDEKIYVADRELPNVFSTDWKKGGLADLQPAGTPSDKVMSLCSSDKILYGLLKKDGYPAERFTLDKRYATDDLSNGMVKFNNAWGDFVPADKYLYESIQPNSPWAGFVPDPSDKRKFFFTIPNVNVIVSVRDLFGHLGYNSLGILGGEYPAEKSKNTYRMLLCGDCRTTNTDAFLCPADSHPMTHPVDCEFFPQNLSLAPQVEHEMNFQAALDDNPMNYEFLAFGRHGNLILWPTNTVPEEVKKLDIDMVVVFSPTLDYPAYYYYFMEDLTSDGVPHDPPDPEYVLKPPLERIQEGLPRKFYDYCKANGLVKIEGNKFIWADDKIKADPKLHDMVLEFWGKPWDVLNRKISRTKTSRGTTPKLLILLGYFGPQSAEHYIPDFYKEVAEKYGISYCDMNPTLNALNLSYYPYGYGHLDPNGAVFFGKLLTQIFKKEHLIPWPIPEKASAK
jgi:hypothetical protein